MSSISTRVINRLAGYRSSRVVHSLSSLPLLQDGLPNFTALRKQDHNITTVRFTHSESTLTSSHNGCEVDFSCIIRRIPTTPQEKIRVKKKRIVTPSENVHLVTPSEYLISVMETYRYDVGITKPKEKRVDLSHWNPSAVSSFYRGPSRKIEDGILQVLKPRLACTTVVADYLRYVYPLLNLEPLEGLPSQTYEKALDDALLSAFDDESLQYLSNRGYSVADVMTWAWILTSSSPLQAAMRYRVFEKQVVDKHLDCSRIPFFVLLFTLRRKHICARAFRILFFQTWDTINDSLSAKPPTAESGLKKRRAPSSHRNCPWHRSGDVSTIMILAVRLLRLAREVWPQALPSVAALFTQTLGSTSAEMIVGEAYDKRIRLLTQYYNKLISLLAIPCRLNPYHSVVFQQRAQFQLLRAMSNFSPPLPVTREGYRSITTVQLAQKKTMLERQWADFKAQSWPPWKEEKLGIDFEKDNVGSESKALKSIFHMREAGYGMTTWEQTATIYAGWDTDRSPTIQTRTFLPKPCYFRILPSSAQIPEKPCPITGATKSGDKEVSLNVWSARIRATRTLKEAWACFLSYQDNGLPPHRDIYFSMAEKIIFYDLSQNPNSKLSTEALPGDGMEVFPEPSSPQDVIYVHSEPPSLDVLLHQMFSHNLKPSGKFLILLLVHSKSLEAGVEYLLHSCLPYEQKYALVSGLLRGRLENEVFLADVPDDIFAAFIRLLCKFSVLGKSSVGDSTTPMRHLFPILFFLKEESKLSASNPSQSTETAQFHHYRALTHAVRLMKSRMTRYLPAWNNLLLALGKDRVHFTSHKISLSMQLVISWWEISHVVEWMRDANIPIENRSLEILCSTLSRMILAARQDIEGAEHGLRIIENVTRQTGRFADLLSYSTIHEMVQQGIAFLKRQFKFIEVTKGEKVLSSLRSPDEITTDDPRVTLPIVYEYTAPSLLHAYARALGLAQDFCGLLALLRWMRERESELILASGERMGGKRLMRRTVVAVRFFLDCQLERSPGVSEPGSASTFPTSKPPIFGCRQHSKEGPNIAGGTQGTMIFEDPITQEAYDIIESTELLSPWPTDEEVREYVAILRKPRR
ncbi:hypothetical protein PAAG_01973 [Paracoccidioides lutzii Pb01]|uniref:Uncharacterized protein n=1 Tax=Paracoccidioides lutzii (strain ATCC MYA-826 / Pb01) TaxID=502779 RepID=C1GTX8_PARBA|nr:hypothetical protein PAAG_01973 [Paracoccidioides lutzii Pb01]EEH39784.1 hypothetical protein PAAG_01973 [Paracoccidioides lutzii Pb01]